MFPNLLDETLDAWTDARHGVIAEIENIPADRFDERPAPDLRSAAELGRHILEVALMMIGELTRDDGDFTRAAFPELLSEYASHVPDLTSRDELLDALRTNLEDGKVKLREAGEIHMLQIIHRFDGQAGTRLAWMHHGIAQEEYHRGQLTWVARLFGTTPALTKLILGE